MKNNDVANGLSDELKSYLSSEINRIRDSLKTQNGYDVVENIEENEKKRSAFITRYRTIPIGCESFLTVLRRWNSYTPSLPLDSDSDKILNQFSVGGGYFLFIQAKEDVIEPGYGLVIDPGYNFIHNFGLCGFSLDDIDGILITHAHNDHTNDFESLLSLLYQRNDKFLGIKNKKNVDLFMNVGAFKKFSNYLDLSKNEKDTYIGNVIVMSPGQEYRIPNRDLDFQILTLYCKHPEIVTKNYSLGICFKVNGRNILFTSDTGWNSEVIGKNIKFLLEKGVDVKGESETNKIDVLIPHIGSIKRTEFNISTEPDMNEVFYGSHLGLLGVLCAIEKWKPEITLISEFGEELRDVRESLTREIKETCIKFYNNNKCNCIAADIGLFLMLDSKRALCYAGENFVDWKEIDYMDLINDQSKQNEIKYFSKNIYKDLANKKALIETIKIRNGVNFVRKYCYEKIAQSYDLNYEQPIKENILNFLSSIVYDYEDSYDNPSDFEVYGNFFALSCFFDNPYEVLNISTYIGPNYMIKEFLDAYQINTELYDLFIKKNATLLPDVNSIYNNSIFKANQQLIQEFAKLYANGDFKAAHALLDKNGCASIENV